MRQAVIAHMGGPDNAAELRIFLRNIFLDTEMMRLPFQPLAGRLLALSRFRASRENYEKTGWTPVKKISASLAEKLNLRLAGDGFSVRPLYTHVPPYIEEAATNAVIVPLYPQYSSSLAGAMKKRAPGRTVTGSWHDSPEFIEMTAESIKKSLSGLDPAATALMFVAHSLPESFSKRGDPYINQVKETFDSLAGYFSGYSPTLSYIGKAGPQKWEGPGAREVITSMKNTDNIVAAYISFPLDNIEVLYDMDIALRENALAAGIKNFIRAPLPNDSDAFADLIAEIIRRNK